MDETHDVTGLWLLKKADTQDPIWKRNDSPDIMVIRAPNETAAREEAAAQVFYIQSDPEPRLEPDNPWPKSEFATCDPIQVGVEPIETICVEGRARK